MNFETDKFWNKPHTKILSVRKIPGENIYYIGVSSEREARNYLHRCPRPRWAHLWDSEDKAQHELLTFAKKHNLEVF